MSLVTQNIWCVGRNYADHAKEMNAPIPKAPLIFLKSAGCLNSSSKIQLPSWSKEIHHEVELALMIDDSLNISHVTLALDLTARDAQAAAKISGQPWTLAKSFTGACPIGSWLSILDLDPLETLQLSLKKNGSVMQTGHVTDMIFKPQILLDYIKLHFPLSAGDIVLTGTPGGVGPILSGNNLVAELQSQGLTLLTCHWDVI